SAELIKGLSNKVTLDEKSSTNPALGSYQNKLYPAWKGLGNDNLNTIFSLNNGRTFVDKETSSERSESGPALGSEQSLLFVGWRGVDNNQLNVGRVPEFLNKVTLNETSTAGPALGRYREKVLVAWKGLGNDNLNVIYSLDGGHRFIGKYTSPETS